MNDPLKPMGTQNFRRISGVSQSFSLFLQICLAVSIFHKLRKSRSRDLFVAVFFSL